MNLLALLRALAWAFVVGFLADALRRCWIVEAWSVGIVAAVLLTLALIPLFDACRSVRRRRLPADFVRPRLPVSSFPEQPKRPIR